MRAFLPAFLLALCLQTGSAAADAISKIDTAVQAEVPRGFFGAVLVAHNSAILLNNGYGSVRGIPVTRNARFWIASGGKQFTSAAILRCHEKGWLSLNDTLQRFFPDAPMDKRAITILELLSHTSGLNQSYVSEGATDRTQAVQRMLAQPLIDTPGHEFHYSNDNYQLAVAIVETVSGQPYQAFVEKELIKPAGLRNTDFAGTREARDVLPGTADTPARLLQSSWGGEGVFSTTADLDRWFDELRAGHVLAKPDVGALFTPVTTIEEGQAALGWFIGRTVRGATQIFTRGNEDWGPNALLYNYPSSGYTVVVLTHAGNAPDGTSWSRFILAKIEKLLLP